MYLLCTYVSTYLGISINVHIVHSRRLIGHDWPGIRATKLQKKKRKEKEIEIDIGQVNNVCTPYIHINPIISTISTIIPAHHISWGQLIGFRAAACAARSCASCLMAFAFHIKCVSPTAPFSFFFTFLSLLCSLLSLVFFYLILFSLFNL